MAISMAAAIQAGQRAASAEPMEPRDMASPSTPVIGQAFLS
jgi:thiazole synthase